MNEQSVNGVDLAIDSVFSSRAPTDGPLAFEENESIDELTIVMPCLNEAETIAVCVRKALAALTENGIRGQVIVADNGSSDGSQEIARSNGARVVDVPIKGYGAALAAGISAANSHYILMADADDSYEFNHVPRFIAELRKGTALVMGNRFLGGIQPGAMPFLHKYLGNPVLSFLGRLLFHAPVNDFHCGLRAFSKEGYQRLDLRTTGMEFASEMVVKASLFGLSMTEVPTILKPDGRSRAPHLRTWRDGWRHLRFLLMYSPRWLFLYPGLLLMGLGVLATAWLIPAQRQIGSVHFGVDTLAYTLAAILLGFHAIVFATSARIFAMTEGLSKEEAWLVRLFGYITLETGLIAGGATFVVSLVLTLVAVSIWGHSGYGPLIAERMLRITLPSATGMVLGAETCFTSFFLSMLGMRRR